LNIEKSSLHRYKNKANLTDIQAALSVESLDYGFHYGKDSEEVCGVVYINSDIARDGLIGGHL
jgi:hypothetical protein